MGGKARKRSKPRNTKPGGGVRSGEGGEGEHDAVLAVGGLHLAGGGVCDG